MLVDSPPALEGQTSIERISNHLNAMCAARAAFIKLEACEKLRRAIRAKTRTATSLIYEPGDLVYFKQENSNLWKGPGTVKGTEKKQILVKYGGTYLRVHACRLQHAKDVKMIPECEIEDEEDQTNIITAEISKNETFAIYDKSGLSTTSSDTIVNQENNQSSDSNSQNIANEITSNSNNTENDISESAYPVKNYTKLPKINDPIVYINPELNTLENVVIISRAGKAAGKNKYWLNVKIIDTGSFRSVDFSKVKDWHYLEE